MTFAPTRWMRAAGVIAVVGGLLILWAFVSWNPFDDRDLNSVRLLLFWSGGAVVALAYHERQIAARPLLGRTAGGAVVLFGGWNALWVLLARSVDSPFSGGFGFVGFVAGFSGWFAASVYGAAMLASSGAWRGMDRWAAITLRLAAALLVPAGVAATFGMDRLGLSRSEPFGELFGDLGALGVGGVALAWVLMGLVLVVSGLRHDETRLTPPNVR